MKKIIKKVLTILILVLSLCIYKNAYAESINTKVYIDYPSIHQEVKDTLKIQGWVMSKVSNTELKVYIDNEEIEVDREVREDVYKVITEYGTREENPNNGFIKEIDIKNQSYGKHTVKVEVRDSLNNILTTETQKFTRTIPKTKLYIDYPTSKAQVVDTVKIQGWAMSTSKNTKIKAYIDTEEVSVDRHERNDVYKAITDYGTKENNPNNGYIKEVDIKNLNYGEHTVKVEVLDEFDNLITTETQKFIRIAPKSIAYIDYPSVNQKVKNTLKIQGWAMSTSKNTKLKVYIDDEEVSVDRHERNDVYKAITEYGTREENPNNGFIKEIDIKNLKYGEHIVKVEVLDEFDNVLVTETQKFVRELPNSKVYIDYPSVNQKVKNTVKIQGWAMSTAGNITIKAYIDNQEVSIDRHERNDVYKVITEYGTKEENPNNGFIKEIDIKNLKYGEHIVRVDLIDRFGNILTKDEKKFIYDRYENIINIDLPGNDIVKTQVHINGWYLIKKANTHVNLYIDNTKIENVYTKKRPDVIAVYSVYKEYMDNQNAGYDITYDTKGLKDGKHTIKIEVIDDDNNDIAATKTKEITIKKYEGLLYIEYPSVANVNKDIEVVGWEMSELDNSYVKLFIDDQATNYTFNRSERNDVIDSIKGYGDSSVNATPGYNTTIPISSLSQGRHKITINLYTRLNEKIASETRYILVYNNRYNGIDISVYNNVYDWNQVKKSGIDYVIARAAVRGYGINNQGIDGNLVPDSTFENHVNQAFLHGMKVGAYVYSQAINEFEGVKEVELMINKVESVGGKSKVSLPLVIDTEFSSCEGRCGRADHLSREQRTRIVKTMAETIKSRGYTPMIYASTSFLNNQLDMSQLSEYNVWVAHYGVEQPTYKGPYQIWQYTSDGSVSGIAGRVDMNYFYYKY